MKAFENVFYGLYPDPNIDIFLLEESNGFVVDSLPVLRR